MENSRSINDRISTLVKVFGDGKNTLFASLVGTSEGNIRGYLKGVMPKQDVLEKIAINLEINSEWLLTGRGEMQQTEQPPSAICEDPASIVHKADSLKEGIPLIPIDAMAGVLTSEISVLEYECERYIIPMFKGADFLINVKGNSMYPKYNSGDIVACKRVPIGDLFFQWNKVYVIDTNQGALIKRIKPGSDKEHVLIVSENDKYDPFELCTSCIHAVALVVGVIRLE